MAEREPDPTTEFAATPPAGAEEGGLREAPALAPTRAGTGRRAAAEAGPQPPTALDDRPLAQRFAEPTE
ncbi:hypothetical protein [Actinomadura sp. 9N215]|uniref:hypothetical protein n=1 Tax=Actinomadura sp. 9N215 TaxID=3375150 RepID=UPI0037A9F90B